MRTQVKREEGSQIYRSCKGFLAEMVKSANVFEKIRLNVREKDGIKEYLVYVRNEVFAKSLFFDCPIGSEKKGKIIIQLVIL